MNYFFTTKKIAFFGAIGLVNNLFLKQKKTNHNDYYSGDSQSQSIQSIGSNSSYTLST
ncbi:MAG: hypothetical protein H7331_02555 [Bacteroidia bacterium]|nr:hypothetical protein [Bacteroidia bacterium]